MSCPRNDLSTLVLVRLFIVLAALGSFSTNPVLSFPRSPFECKDQPAAGMLAWCEDIHEKWVRPTYLPEFQCQGLYRDGRKPAPGELKRILSNHAEWLSIYGDRLSRGLFQQSSSTSEARADARRANLCGADLRHARLQGVDLRHADLRRANLSKGNLTGADLAGADLNEAIVLAALLDDADLTGASLPADLCGSGLRRAKLSGLVNVNLSRASLSEMKLNVMHFVNLCGATLGTVDLSDASIMNVILTDAGIGKVDFRGSILENVNLRRARLSEVDLQKATLINVDLTDLFFPTHLYPSNLNGLVIIGAAGLSTIKFWNPADIATLRKTLKEYGLRSEERGITSAWRKFALKTEPIHAQHFAYYVGGGWATDYGADPWGSFTKLGWSILVGTFIYLGVLWYYGRWKNSKKRAGIWAIWPGDRIHKAEGGEPVRVTSRFFFPNLQARAAQRWWRRPLRWCCILLAGFYFSLLSAFHIGWRELSVGTWISRLQPREYTLRATGWVRFVSGAQSLFSMYLLAWWAVTYFGRPFE